MLLAEVFVIPELASPCRSSPSPARKGFFKMSKRYKIRKIKKKLCTEIGFVATRGRSWRAEELEEGGPKINK